MKQRENKHRPISQIIEELLHHPELLRLEWITKDGIKDEFEFFCEMKGIHSELDTETFEKQIERKFEDFWEKKYQELKENSFRFFEFQDDFIPEFIEDYFVEEEKTLTFEV